MKSVASLIGNATISPTGVRAAFEARGDIFTVARGRQLSQHHAELGRARSRSGVVAGWQADRVVLGCERRVSADDRRSDGRVEAARDRVPDGAYFSEPAGRPTRQHMLLRDTRRANSGRSTSPAAASRRSTRTRYDDPRRGFDAAWSPDSRWVAYSKSLPSHMRAIFLYSLAHGQEPADHRRPGRRDLAGVRRERQVSLLPREHELRTEDRLARHELEEHSVRPQRLSRGA